MKKFLLFVGLAVSTVALAQTGYYPDLTGSPTGQASAVTIPTANIAILVQSNRAEVYSFSILSTNSGFLYFYGANSTNSPGNGTNYITQTNVTSAAYSTNYVTSFVGYNGYTNWYTNVGNWTYYVTNLPATNQLNPLGVFPYQANVPITYPVNILAEKGITVVATTVPVTFSYFYRPAR